MNSRILNFFNVKLDAFIVFVSVVVVIMFIALFFLLKDEKAICGIYDWRKRKVFGIYNL